ncbi:hypothetical protein AAU61_19615 [Desulfocarbo indianensis]|nr:hypothetical protein AAU61_19615 [Desulfocarbo indianensis]
MDSAPRLCPSCGLATCRRFRLDHYLSLFFLPLFPVKRGQEFWECSRCGRPCGPGAPAGSQGRAGGRPPNCPNCGRPLGDDFSFCPGCGRRL